MCRCKYINSSNSKNNSQISIATKIFCSNQTKTTSDMKLTLLIPIVNLY